ncbi:SMI1/KNR4 family protein [Streptomyces griseoloalbus]|uniref:Knr4/Smi1-like domain-containing protein n=1 Tax=Streptomyces griseoloalbus TaxID=67303 RepID=A0A7W8BP01_9ACTN|nr:SMI1/KNR4 family protein [Streptomyces albaduncus]MBB5125861.1 hypothetical protein [Streptomyces albaduncus]
MRNVEWGPLLKRWSEEWLEALAAEEPEEFEELLGEDFVENRWLGFAPADPARLAALEERIRGLGTEVPLPPSLRSFLGTTDGWRHAGGSVHLLAGAEDIRPYGDPYGLRQMYEERLGADPADEDVLLAGMWGRALQLSLDSDLTDVLLDPGDVDADGEWAVYVYHGWGGEPPDRYESFRAFMEAMYKEFYRLGGDHPDFATAVTRELDAKVEEARLACLRGEVDAALAVFDEAGELGRPRAGLLASQLRALLDGGRGWVPVDPRMDDPLYAAEVLPLKARNHLREAWRDDSFVLGPATEDYATDRERAAVVLAQLRQRTYEYASPGPFGHAVKEARERARWGDTDGAWRVLAAAVPQWEPYREDHVAPFGLLGDPLLGPVVTPERGRQLLTTPRAGRTGERPAPVAEARGETEAVRDGLGWLARSRPAGAPLREVYRFVLVEGISPEELAERFGRGPLEPVASEAEAWDLQFSRPQQGSGGPVARICRPGRLELRLRVGPPAAPRPHPPDPPRNGALARHPRPHRPAEAGPVPLRLRRGRPTAVRLHGPPGRAPPDGRTPCRALTRSLVPGPCRTRRRSLGRGPCAGRDSGGVRRLTAPVRPRPRQTAHAFGTAAERAAGARRGICDDHDHDQVGPGRAGTWAPVRSPGPGGRRTRRPGRGRGVRAWRGFRDPNGALLPG